MAQHGTASHYCHEELKGIKRHKKHKSHSMAQLPIIATRALSGAVSSLRLPVQDEWIGALLRHCPQLELINFGGPRRISRAQETL